MGWLRHPIRIKGAALLSLSFLLVAGVPAAAWLIAGAFLVDRAGSSPTDLCDRAYDGSFSVSGALQLEPPAVACYTGARAMSAYPGRQPNFLLRWPGSYIVTGGVPTLWVVATAIVVVYRHRFRDSDFWTAHPPRLHTHR